MENSYDFLKELDNSSYDYWVPTYKESGIDFGLVTSAPCFGSLRANYSSRVLTFTYKKHAIMFTFQRELGEDSSIIMTIWNNNDKPPIQLYVELKTFDMDFRKLTIEDLAFLLKRSLLGEGLYNVTRLPPRMRKAVFEFTDKVKDVHVNSYRIRKGYVLSKHRQRWRLHYHDKLCIDVIHLCMITEHNFYHMAV